MLYRVYGACPLMRDERYGFRISNTPRVRRLSSKQKPASIGIEKADVCVRCEETLCCQGACSNMCVQCAGRVQQRANKAAALAISEWV